MPTDEPTAYDTLRYEVTGAVATLTIDNPSKRNSLTMGTFGGDEIYVPFTVVDTAGEATTEAA